MKTILKIMLVVVLMSTLVGISFIKSGRTAKRETTQTEAIKSKIAIAQDSIFMTQLADSSRHYVDSLIAMDAFYQTQIDSINKYHTDIEAKLKADLAKVKKSAKTVKKTTPKKKKKVSSNKSSKNQKIKTEYKKLLSKLPADLTQYEKRVAYNEVKVDLAKKHKISPQALEKIIR